MKRRHTLLLSALLLLAGCAVPIDVLDSTGLPTAEPPLPTAAVSISATATPQPLVERVVFTSRRNGNEEIYRINLDGSGLVRLTEHPARDFSPAPAPDLSQVAFVSDRGGTDNIYLIESDGANLRRVSNEPLGADSPAFSVDGLSLFYVAKRITGRVLMRFDLQDATQTIAFTNPADIGSPALSPDGKRIAFSARDGRDTGRDIFVANLDRTGALINLTNRAGEDEAPGWSPDGLRIVFQTDRDGDNDIFTMSADGSVQTPLIDTPADETHPSWSRDGRTIVYAVDGDLSRSDDSGSTPLLIAVTAAAELDPQLAPAPRLAVTEQLLVTSGGTSRVLELIAIADESRRPISDALFADALTAAWSPDGRRFVFSADRNGNYDLYLLNADGSGLRRLTDHAARDLHPAWSPDGRTIAFESNRNGQWDVFLVPADGGAAVALTSDPSDEGNPSWAPDSNQLVFASNRSGDFELYLGTVDGRSALRRLTDDPATDVFPVWSPAGDVIVFRSNRSGDNELYLIDLNGSTRRLTFHNADDTTPTFSPDGGEVAFASSRTSSGGTSGSKADYDIYVISISTLEIRRVVGGAQDERYPAWRPR